MREHACRAPRRAQRCGSTSAYSSPPTKTSARSGSSHAPRRADRAERGDQGQARRRGPARRSPTVDIDGEGDHDHELRQEQHRLGEDQPAGVQAGVVLGRARCGRRSRRRWRARRRPAAPGSCGASRDDRPRKPCVVVVPTPGSRSRRQRRSASRRPRPATHGAERDAEQRAGLVGRHADQRGADHQPRGRRCEHVEHGERAPPALALEDAGLAAHDRERHRRRPRPGRPSGARRAAAAPRSRG